MHKTEPYQSSHSRTGETLLDQDYWNTRWENQETGWDIGEASPAITTFMGQYANKNAAILIPGCGNAHEAGFLIEKGFTNITLIDIAPKAVEKIKHKFDNYKQVKVLQADFFKHTGSYDVVIEQTFFCALNPSKRKDYAHQMAQLINPAGILVGVMFNKTFESPGPPFGGTAKEYLPIFEPLFHIKSMENCYNSIAPRAGQEIFVHFIKKQQV